MAGPDPPDGQGRGGRLSARFRDRVARLDRDEVRAVALPFLAPLVLVLALVAVWLGLAVTNGSGPAPTPDPAPTARFGSPGPRP